MRARRPSSWSTIAAASSGGLRHSLSGQSASGVGGGLDPTDEADPPPEGADRDWGRRDHGARQVPCCGLREFRPRADSAAGHDQVLVDQPLHASEAP